MKPQLVVVVVLFFIKIQMKVTLQNELNKFKVAVKEVVL